MLSNAAKVMGRRGRWRRRLMGGTSTSTSTSRTTTSVWSSSCWTDHASAADGVLVVRMLGSAAPAAARRSSCRGFSSHHRGPPSEERGDKVDPDDDVELLNSDGRPLQQRSKNEESKEDATFHSSSPTSTSHTTRIKTYTSQPQLILPSVAGLDEWRQKQDLDRAEQQQQQNDDTLQYPVHELYRPDLHLPSAPTDWTGYEAATPLSDEVCALIGVTGRPVSVADYMRMALQHPEHGYYTRAQSSSSSEDDFDDDDDVEEHEDVLEKNKDRTATTARTTTKNDTNIIGGDFVTAPEVSHVFGECLGVWFGIQAAQNNISEWQFLECGPGKASLMVDLLRFTRSLSRQRQKTTQHNFGDGCRRVHFVETSPALRRQQRDALVDNFRHDFHFVFEEDEDDTKNAASTTTPVRSGAGRQPEYKKKPRISVHWHSSLEDFRLWQQRTLQPDQLLPTFAVAQEFVDALPVYAFEKTKEGYWRERLVDVALRDDVAQDLLEEEEEQERKNVQAKMEEKGEEVPPLSAAAAAVDATTPPSAMDLKQKKPRLRIVLAPEVTPPLRTLLQTDVEGRLPYDDPAPPGSIVEVCPEGILFAQDLATVLGTQGGAALMIDYGSARGSRDSLRGFSRHKQVHFLSRPGQVDITADVDFRALQHAVNVVQQQKHAKLPASPPAAAAVENKKSNGSSSSITDGVSGTSPRLQTAHAHGPVTQGAFLVAMGLQERIVNLMERDEVTDEQAEDLYQAMVRLVSPEQMGERYKVLAITTARDDADGAAAADPPPGFENATTL